MRNKTDSKIKVPPADLIIGRRRFVMINGSRTFNTKFEIHISKIIARISLSLIPS